MSIKFEKVRAGDVLWSKSTGRMGNTTVRTTLWHRVHVLRVDSAKQTAEVSWNGNPPETYRRQRVERLYRKKPEPKGRTS